MSIPSGPTPILNHLRRAGYEVAQRLSTKVGETSDGPIHSHYLAPITDDAAEGVLSGLVEHFHMSEDGVFLRQEIDMLEDALRAIRARIQGEYDLPALVEAGPLGDKDGDILRLIAPVLRE